MDTKLSEQDKQLLRLLQEEDACTPRVTKLAHKLGVPTSTLHAKLKRLKSLGVIKGYSAVLSPEKVGAGQIAFIMGRASAGKEIDFDKEGEEFAKIPYAQGVYFIVGEKDFLIKMRVKNIDDYYEKVKKVAKLTLSGGGIIVSKNFKDTHKVVIE